MSIRKRPSWCDPGSTGNSWQNEVSTPESLGGSFSAHPSSQSCEPQPDAPVSAEAACFELPFSVFLVLNHIVSRITDECQRASNYPVTVAIAQPSFSSCSRSAPRSPTECHIFPCFKYLFSLTPQPIASNIAEKEWKRLGLNLYKP